MSKVAAVFGASGGIGRALVEHLADRGDVTHIYAGGRRPPVGLGPCVQPFAFDLTEEASIAAAVAGMAERPDLVIVASGLLHDADRAIAPEKSLRAIDGEAMARIMAINTIGPALVAKHVLPILPRDRRAVFAVLSARVGSISDNRLGGWHAYRASKAALNMLLVNFAIEMQRTHPQAIVAALHPGTVATGLSAPFQRGVAPEKLFTPETCAASLLDVIGGLSPADSGGFFAWDGARLPW